MTGQAALLEQVLNDPADDTARLVLADLLRESDDPAEQARGRFLWAGVTASRFRDDDLIDDPLYYTAQREIEAIASAGHPMRWLAALGIGQVPHDDARWAWDCTHDRVTVMVGQLTAVFTRGMLTGLTLGLAEWQEWASSIVKASPLESVIVSDVQGLTFTIEKDSTQTRWLLILRLKLPPRRTPLMSGQIPTSMAPSPVLVETDRDWNISELWTTRQELVEGVGQAARILVECLQEAVGTAWPSWPR